MRHRNPIPPIALAAAVLCWPAAAQAAEGTVYDPNEGHISDWLAPQAVPDSTWSGEVELGGLQTSGNSDTESVHLRSRVLNDRPRYRNSGRLEAIYTDGGDAPPAEQYRLAEKTALKLTEDNYLFAAFRYDRSVAQGVEYRFAEVTGAGRRMYQDEKNFLLLELGTGARQTRRTDERALQREPIAVVQSEFNWQWRGGSVFNTYLVMEYGEFNTLEIAQTSLTLRIQGAVSARFGYEVTSNSSVPKGIDHVDRLASVTLVYQF